MHSAASAPGRKQRGNEWKCWAGLRRNAGIRNILGAANPTERATGGLALCISALALLRTAQKGDLALYCECLSRGPTESRGTACRHI